MSLVQKVTGSGISGATAADSAMAVVPAPYDSMLSSSPAVGVNAAVVFPATPGKRWVVATIAGSLYSAPGAVYADYLRILDGATILFNVLLVTPPVAALGGAGDKFGLSDLAYIGTTNTAVTVKFSGTGISTQQAVSAGAYLV